MYLIFDLYMIDFTFTSKNVIRNLTQIFLFQEVSSLLSFKEFMKTYFVLSFPPILSKILQVSSSGKVKYKLHTNTNSTRTLKEQSKIKTVLRYHKSVPVNVKR